ncbi:NAD-dependent succinate-semialdehyde dehydrogenase [Marinomonas sp. M1K-6]|uniref:NAD-dependent succinate-semialdehyde dehydrogenase n=1 Tax=Marinomonas profundi TaxID=2726122 RepID=A0A847RAS8_9GAMM|nr:NAD-dependent succinate-semialdehyde dehydrogenase [Marinomonas profundi]NLQ17340.1 NAD-dependent succinate-semialdehyde dehydrogenase [Marinomonas profundi]UDV01868.1 NAD-dependent succinate-semialdehyde dehydrogenase [Marinomonas profundi]
MLELNNKALLQTKCLINGEWVESAEGNTLDVFNPATGELVATIASVGPAETQQAIIAAEAAQKIWKKKTAKERATLLRRWHDLLMANQEDLAKLMTAEQGKPLAESRGEIGYAASFIEWFAEEGKRIYGDMIPTYAPDRRILVMKEPVGVCAAITPWNFPAAMITRKAGPALAAGCTMIIKPASETPLSALAMGVLAIEAGIPAGVINIVVGKASPIAKTLTDSSVVRKLTFTGSTPIGKLLMKDCADTMKKVSLELGGNAPFVVFDDANIDDAVAGAMMSKYRNAGQTCVCANRIYVQAGVYDTFVEKFAAQVSAMKIGHGTENGVEQGPLINRAAVDKVDEHVQDAISKGGKVVTGGKRHELGDNFYHPTVIANATQDMLFAKEETFGPLAPIFKFETEDDVIAMANDTEYGLASYFYSRDIGRIFRVAEALETGLVGVNAGVIATEVAPFGGYKESGLGREGSKYGIEDYINTKYVCLAGLDK